MKRSLYAIRTLFLLSTILFLSACTGNTGSDTALYTNEQKQSQQEETTNPASPTQAATAPTTPAEETKNPPKKNTYVDIKVPFTSQAPTGNWDDERQQDGCEEASALMAVRWAQGKGISSGEALREITALSDYEQRNYGEFRDISLSDVKKWIFNDYFKYAKVEVRLNASAQDIIDELQAGNVVLAPMNGQKLGNPYFSGAGPERHMLLIRGYDPEKNQFITNDPGTKRGEGYRYSVETIMNANLAYPTGHHETISGNPKGVIIVRK